MVIKKTKEQMMDLFEGVEEGGATQKVDLPSKQKLTELGNYISKMKELSELITRRENELKELSQKFNDLQCNKIPDFFDELGLSTLSLVDGTKVIIERKFTASITAENSGKCLEWLEKNNYGSLIKHDVVTKLKKGEEKLYTKLIAVLKKEQMDYTDKKYVHPQTLSSFVKEQMSGNGAKKFPQELFKVFPLRFTKLK